MIPVLALVFAFSASPSFTTTAQVTANIPVTLNKAAEKFTPKSLAGEYTLVVTDAYKKEMQADGIKEITGKVVLNADGTFEFQSFIVAAPDRNDSKYSNRDSKIKGDFKIEGNLALLTSKSETLDGKQIKHDSSVVKFTISVDGKELKPVNLTIVSFVRK